MNKMSDPSSLLFLSRFKGKNPYNAPTEKPAPETEVIGRASPDAAADPVPIRDEGGILQKTYTQILAYVTISSP